VQKESNGKQVPWDSSSLVGDFYFVPPDEKPEPATIATLTPTPAPESRPTVTPSEFRADEEAWKDIKNSSDLDDFRFFLEEFPASPLAKTAKFKLRRLERKQPKAKAEQQQIAEEAKRLEEERKRLAAEKRQLAKAKRKADTDKIKEDYDWAIREGVSEAYQLFLDRYEDNPQASRFIQEIRQRALTERKLKKTFPFSGVQCQFTLLRPHQGYQGNPVDEKIAEGSVKIIDDQVHFAGGWFTGGNATSESFTDANIKIDDSGRLSGEMMAYHMFTSWFEKSVEPVHVILSRTNEKLIFGETFNAFQFPMGRMIGELNFSSCSR
jgi:hypothetical protein